MKNLEAALDLLKRRKWSVIPINPKTKLPMIKWGEYQNRLPTEAEVRRWWEERPNANIGIVTGKISGIVVIDLDAKHLDPISIDSIRKAYKTGTSVRTGGGGYHLYFEYPKNAGRIQNRVNDNGLDVRGDGGYVLAPPSTHASGRTYEWVSKPNGMAPAPSFLLEERDTGSSNGHTPEDKWLTRTLRGVGEGERNQAAARLAGYYYKKGLPEDVVLSMMIDWNEKNGPPLPEIEIRTTVESVYRTATRRVQQDAQRKPIEDPLRLMDLSRYMAHYGQREASWIVKDWIPEQTIAMAVAPPGTYKTWLHLDLALSIAMGGNFLGQFPVIRRGPVLIFQQEDFHGQTAERIATIMNSKIEFPMLWDAKDFEFQMPPKPPIYLHPDRHLKFEDGVIMDALREKVAAIRPVLVIIDPLYSAGDVQDYMAPTVQRMFQLKDLRDQFGCSFLLVHHTSKGAKGTERESGWGTQFLNAFIETGWQVRPHNKPNQTVVRRHFKVSKNIDEVVLNWAISTDLPLQYSVGIETGPMLVEDFSITDVMRLAQIPLTTTEVANALEVSVATASRKLKKMVNEGVIIRLEDGKYELRTVAQ